jgi:hypothetical protein
MNRYPQERIEGKAEASRKQFADGSALLTYRDGSVLILESNLAKPSIRVVQRINYLRMRVTVAVA